MKRTRPVAILQRKSLRPIRWDFLLSRLTRLSTKRLLIICDLASPDSHRFFRSSRFKVSVVIPIHWLERGHAPSAIRSWKSKILIFFLSRSILQLFNLTPSIYSSTFAKQSIKRWWNDRPFALTLMWFSADQPIRPVRTRSCQCRSSGVDWVWNREMHKWQISFLKVRGPILYDHLHYSTARETGTNPSPEVESNCQPLLTSTAPSASPASLSPTSSPQSRIDQGLRMLLLFCQFGLRWNSRCSEFWKEIFLWE